MRGRPTTISDEDILDAARDVFLRRGLEATTAEIAERAGASESLLFYRYKTKEALFVAVIDRLSVLPPVLETLVDRVGKETVDEHLFAVGREIIDLYRTVLPLLMMAWSSPTKMIALHEKMQHPNPVHVRMIKLLAGYFEAETQARRLRPVDAEILARAFIGGVGDYVMSQILHRAADTLPLASPTFLRGLIHILLDGARE